MMGAQFRDERCAACGHGKHWHEQTLPGWYRSCEACPTERRCQRFVERAERKEEEAEG